MTTTATYNEPSLIERTAYRLQQVPRDVRAWLTKRLIAAVVALNGDTNYAAHAKRELAPSLADGEDGPNRWMARDLMQLLAVFGAQGHSGSSAPWCASAFQKLSMFEPLGPLTGADDEWFDHGYCMQNKRCSRVFKQADRFNGQAYDIEGRIFREPNGACYMNGESHVPVTFPYTPTREYVDVSA